MFYVRIENGRAVEARDEAAMAFATPFSSKLFENRNDWKTLERATQVASELTEATSKQFIAIDCGANVSPRYDVILAPQVGDEVSKGFNGDYYPEGEIVRISASMKRIETSTGSVFFRRGLSGAWVQGRTWTLVPGRKNERNPSF